MLIHAFLLNFLISAVVTLKIDSVVTTCDGFYNSETRVLMVDNDYSGWHKLQIAVWMSVQTNEVIKVSPKTKIEDLDKAQSLEYLLEYPRNLSLLEVRNVTFNGRVLCSNTGEERNGKTVTVHNLLTIKQAQLNSDECGVKADIHPFFLDAPKPVETPWLVAFYTSLDGKYQYQCAGNLLTDRHVLSVAVCFSGGIPIENYAVVMATDSLKNWVKRAVVRGIKKITVHEEYKPPSQANIALITIDKPVEFTINLKPICILKEKLNPVENGVLSGWGSADSGKELLHVRHLLLSSVKQEDCLRLDPAYYQLVSNRTFCVDETKASPAGPCTGDHGGGFAVLLLKKWTLRGVASIIPGRCNPKLFSIFVDVLKFKDWIIEQIKMS